MTEGQRPDLNLVSIMVKPLYFGIVTNILIPGALLLICYYLNNNYTVVNRLGATANSLFYLFVVLAAVQAALALWLQRRKYREPMIRSEVTYHEDLTAGMMAALRPVFVIIASISFYGYAYFLLTGRFTEAVLFVLGSFLVFQFVRPRHGQVKRLVAIQDSLVQQGRFLRD
jgi:DMSO reductase anchor subunit